VVAILIAGDEISLPSDLQLDVLDVILDDGNVPMEAYISREVIAWPDGLGQWDVTKFGVTCENVTEEDAPKEVDKAHGASFSSYGDHLAVEMQEAISWLLSLLLLVN